MKAVVRNIRAGTRAYGNGKRDSFIEQMSCFIGKEIDVYESFCKDWYRGINVGFSWHKSWLRFTPKYNYQK